MTSEQPAEYDAAALTGSTSAVRGPLTPTYGAGYLQQHPPAGPIGTLRGTGVCMLLYVITFGIYGIVWYYKTHEQMKRHSGQGLGGGLALLIALFAGIAMPYITSSEVGQLYAAAGRQQPVSGATGLWSFPGCFLLIGPIVWFVKTNGALNAYWRSVGAR